MTATIIALFCGLILLAYMFDLSARHTRIPSVVLLLAVGFGLRQAADALKVEVLGMQDVLPVLGTVGLILIVLEGGLDLELNAGKKSVVVRSLAAAVIPLVALMVILGEICSRYLGQPVTDGFLNALPLCIISSAIAIPSVRHWNSADREFIIYESSLSDIVGVILFNYFSDHTGFSLLGLGTFIGQLLLMLLISFGASLLLAFLIKKIDHHVKFIPILMMLILIYVLAKELHLPALIFILLFGLLLNNLEALRGIRFIAWLRPEELDREVERFREIVTEFTFLVRTSFFLVFGWLIDYHTLLQPEVWALTAGVLGLIYAVRFVQLRMLKMPLIPFVFIAPRGLITVLLFLSIPLGRRMAPVNSALLTQVVLLSSLGLMVGLLLEPRTPSRIGDESLVAVDPGKPQHEQQTNQ